GRRSRRLRDDRGNRRPGNRHRRPGERLETAGLERNHRRHPLAGRGAQGVPEGVALGSGPDGKGHPDRAERPGITVLLSLLAALPQAPPEQVLGQRLARLRERVEKRELLALEQMRRSDGSLHLASMIRIRTVGGCESLDWWTPERLGAPMD